MIDFESKNNYILTVLTKREKFFIHSKNKNAFKVFVIKKKFIKKMNQKMISLSVVIQQHHEKLIFDLIKIIIYKIMLKNSWLKKHNSLIDWEIWILTFEKCDCVIDIRFKYWQRTMINERNKIKKLIYIWKENLKINISLLNIDKDQLN